MNIKYVATNLISNFGVAVRISVRLYKRIQLTNDFGFESTRQGRTTDALYSRKHVESNRKHDEELGGIAQAVSSF